MCLFGFGLNVFLHCAWVCMWQIRLFRKYFESCENLYWQLSAQGKWVFKSFAMAGRASNSLSKQEYEKICRANKASVLKADLSMTLDELACKHAGLLQDLLNKTARVSKTSLFEALLAANEGNDPQDSKHFAGRIVEAVSAGRQMSKSMTSGKKTPVGLKVVVDALKIWSSTRTPSRSACHWRRILTRNPHSGPWLCLPFPQAQLPVPKG